MMDNFLARFDDLGKSLFAFLVNPFMIDVVNECYPILAPMVTKSPVVKTALQKGIGLKMIHNLSLRLIF